MFHQLITPMTTKLSFTNSSNPQRSTSPVSTISFYSNAPTCNETRNIFSTQDSRSVILKKPLYFATPNSYSEGPSLSYSQAADISVPTYTSAFSSTTYNDSVKSPEYCPKSPVYKTKPYDNSPQASNESPVFYPSSPTKVHNSSINSPKTFVYIAKVHDVSQQIAKESSVFYPSSPIDVSKVHNSSIDSPEHCPKTPVYIAKELDSSHGVPNDSLELYTSSKNILKDNELRRTTLSEKKGNSIEQIISIGKRKFSAINNDDEQNDKENSVEESFKLNSEKPVDEITSAYDSANSPKEPSKRGNRRSTRLAAKPPLNYRV